ncbi:branched-chain amino acid ABC transporter permease [Thalassovita sp.]|uniref:branched-chain amino acid ABC transporter permease n=1 Tax=Thalassovita sp. TaxID=1979401 RepID=UPI002881E50D|nr:branched-chain amino acid ABC transporter permease [Thalassovita sp.]MDF1804431.1 branched-chain amino acid ABC transporter permease [Thalassovita sp.]
MTIDLKTTLSGVLRIAIVVILLALLPFAVSASGVRLSTEIYIYLSLAMLWNLLAGYAGLVSVGQQAFVGIGAYASWVVLVKIGGPFWLAVAAGAMASGLLALFFSPFLFRLKGATFAIGTWVVAELTLLIVANVNYVGGGGGASVPAAIARQISPDRVGREHAIYWTALAVTALVLTASYLLMRSRWGLALTAMRDEPTASEAVGIDTRRLSIGVFLGVAVLTGAVGGVILLTKLRITPDSAFSLFDWTAYTIFIVVIGGIGRLEGPIVGTAVFFILRVLLADYGPAYLIVLGLLAIGVMLFAPRGLWGAVYARTKLRVLPAGWPAFATTNTSKDNSVEETNL